MTSARGLARALLETAWQQVQAFLRDRPQRSAGTPFLPSPRVGSWSDGGAFTSKRVACLANEGDGGRRR